MITCVVLYATASIVATIFQCSPVRLAFDKSITDGHCIDNAKFWYANAAFSIATDLIILLLPMWLVHKLQIPLAQKMALIIVFALGSFVVATSCLRVTTINIIATTSDKTYDISSTMWTVIEMNVSIVCACLPMVRPLIVKVFPKIMPRSGGNQKYESSPTDGSKSFMTGLSQASTKNERLDGCGGKDSGVQMPTPKRPGSRAGSDDSILGVDEPTDPTHPFYIQKTSHYAVEYVEK